MTEPDSELIVDDTGEIGFVTFNRPAARNALTFSMYEGLAEICSTPPAHLRTLVITGAGKAFAAGTDIAQFKDFSTPQHALDYESKMDDVLGAIEACPLPTIAAIDGACTGGGAAIACACDLRIATVHLKFGFPIAKTLGNCLSAANIARLERLLGPGRVREMIFLSRLIEADEAYRLGLVTEVLDTRDQLMDRATQMAHTLADQAPLTLRATKTLQQRLAKTEVEDRDWIVACYTSEDFKEGMSAFLEKREPRWKGR